MNEVGDIIDEESQGNSNVTKESSTLPSSLASSSRDSSTKSHPTEALNYFKITELLDKAVEVLSKDPSQKDVVFFCSM
jgi:hypothetical protein